MKRRDLLWLVSSAIVLTALPSCSSTKPDIYSDSKGYKNEASMPREQYKFRQINWIFNENDQSYGYEIKRNPQSLEEMAFTDKDERELTEWEMPSLARLIPLKKFIENHSNYYGINPMWATTFFAFESGLNPCDFNKISDDYGLGQIKTDSEKLAKKRGSDPADFLYSPYLDKTKSIFDPKTNITMAMLLHRYNIEKFNLTNSDQAYSIYCRGEASLNPDGSVNDLSKELIKSFHERYDSFQNIIPLFRLKPEDIKKIENKDTRTLMEIYHKNLSIPETYELELDYFLGDLGNQVLGKQLKGDARSVLVYDDCFTFAKALEMTTGKNQKENYKKLLEIGKKIYNLVEDEELKGRMDRTVGLLIEAIK